MHLEIKLFSFIQDDLDDYFGQFGEIKDSVIMVDKATGNPRGFAFVEVGITFTLGKKCTTASQKTPI